MISTKFYLNRNQSGSTRCIQNYNKSWNSCFLFYYFCNKADELNLFRKRWFHNLNIFIVYCYTVGNSQCLIMTSHFWIMVWQKHIFNNLFSDKNRRHFKTIEAIIVSKENSSKLFCQQTELVILFLKFLCKVGYARMWTLWRNDKEQTQKYNKNKSTFRWIN